MSRKAMTMTERDIVSELRDGIDQRNIADGEQLMDKAADEIERLRAAIKWALGECVDDGGLWFGRAPDGKKTRYWWRPHLRRLAALEQKAREK